MTALVNWQDSGNDGKRAIVGDYRWDILPVGPVGATKYRWVLYNEKAGGIRMTRSSQAYQSKGQAMTAAMHFRIVWLDKMMDERG